MNEHLLQAQLEYQQLEQKLHNEEQKLKEFKKEYKKLEKERNKLREMYELTNSLSYPMDEDETQKELKNVSDVNISILIEYLSALKFRIVERTTKAIDEEKHIVYRN